MNAVLVICVVFTFVCEHILPVANRLLTFGSG